MLADAPPLTAADFEAFIQQRENADRDWEFVAGRIQAVVANSYSSRLAARILIRLGVFVEANQSGYLTGADGGYVIGDERYIPDVAFVAKARQPQPPADAYNPIAPDLAVEVLSPTNDPADMRIKVVSYLNAGTLVWLVNPERRQVEVYAPGQAPRTLGMDGTLDGGTLLPGFALAVKDIFADVTE